MNGLTSEFFDATDSWPGQCLRQLETKGAIATTAGRFDYSSVLLSGEDIVDAYDPNHLATSSNIASMILPRPYESNGMQIGHFATILRGYEASSVVSLHDIRRQLLGLSIGDAALARYNAWSSRNKDRSIVTLAQENGILPRQLAERAYVIPNIPLAVVSIRTIIRHATAESGSQMAALYIPSTIHPKMALRWLQSSVKELNERDTAMWQSLEAPTEE